MRLARVQELGRADQAADMLGAEGGGDVVPMEPRYSKLAFGDGKREGEKLAAVETVEQAEMKLKLATA